MAPCTWSTATVERSDPIEHALTFDTTTCRRPQREPGLSEPAVTGNYEGSDLWGANLGIITANRAERVPETTEPGPRVR